MAGEENSWVGEGEDLLLLSRPREAMSSTKEGKAAIARGWGGGGSGTGALGDLGNEGVMGSSLLNGWASSSVSRHSEGWIALGRDRDDKSMVGKTTPVALATFSLDHSVLDHLSPSFPHQS